LGYRLRKKLAPILFIGPFLILFASFCVYPIFYSVFLSFMKLRGYETAFVGFKNYQYILTTPLFYKSMANTFEFLVIQVPLMTALALIFGALLNSASIRLKGMFRLIIFMPVLVDAVSYSIVFSLFFNPTVGLINNFLSVFGVAAIPWTTSGIFAKLVIVFAVTWKWTGYNSVIMLSGMQNIPGELYEAASIDGASAARQLVSITIPSLKPVIVFSVVNSINGMLQIFAEPNIITSGGPFNETLSMVLYLYKTAFVNNNYGVAAAGSYVLAFIIILLTYLQMRVAREAD
jgi:lactose/L-arabinose transport system permease protein